MSLKMEWTTIRAKARGLIFAALTLALAFDLAPAQSGENPAAPDAPGTGSAKARFGMTFEAVDFKPPQVNNTTLDNGITLDHYAETRVPMVTILARLRVGAVNDPAGKVGTAEMTGEVIRNGGTAALLGDDLDRQVESHGAELSVETGREETWFRLSVLKEDLDWGMGLLAGLLANPALPPEKLEEARARAIVAVRQRMDTPMSIAQTLYPQLIYGSESPWGWTETERTLAAITPEDLKAIHERFYVSGNIKLGLSGDVTWEDVQRAARASFGKLESRPAPELQLPEVQPVAQSRVIVAPREVTQNVVYLGHEGVSRFDDYKFPIKVFNEVLSGGFTSRLFKEIRSDRGLAYAVYGVLSEGTAKGVFMNVALTRVATTGQVLELMARIDRDLETNAPRPEEVDLAKQSNINSFVFFFDTPEKIVRQKMTLDGFGYPPDYMATYTDRMRSVTPEQVREAAAARLHLERVVVLVVGQVEPALREQLSKIGPITEIGDQELREKWM